MTIHWCGTGLSAIPGLRRLLELGEDVVVWNRTVSKAEHEVGDLTDQIREFDIAALSDDMSESDIIVSMLPGSFHVPLAELALQNKAHFVSSSYIAPEMHDLDARAIEAGVSLVNEVGLDPGIDHVMAHWLMADYRASLDISDDNEISFISYCGGIPKNPNPFRYKFSWSPIGVLKALMSPSRSIRNGEERVVERPWDAVSSYVAPLQSAEEFEVYPNRDSLPFMQEYGFDPSWKVKEFVRGTLRLNGWKAAWSDIFARVEALDGSNNDAVLAEMAAECQQDNMYEDGEPDRVVLCVSLKAERKGETVYHKTYALDAWGDAHGTAMARLVSVPVSMVVEAVQNGEVETGVRAAPSDPVLVARIMDKVDTLAQHLHVVNHLNHRAF